MNVDNVQLVGNVSEYIEVHDSPLINLEGINLHLIDAAISDKNGSMRLPMCTVTDEECALDNLSPIQEELKKDNKLDYKQVKILTIDDLLRMVRRKRLVHTSRGRNREMSLQHMVLSQINSPQWRGSG